MRAIKTTTDMRWLRKAIGLSPLQAAEVFGTTELAVLEFERRKCGYVVPAWRDKLQQWELAVRSFRAALASDGHNGLVLAYHAVLFRWDRDFEEYGPPDVLQRFEQPYANVYNHSIVQVNFDLGRPWTLVEFSEALFREWRKDQFGSTILQWAVEHARTYKEYSPPALRPLKKHRATAVD